MKTVKLMLTVPLMCSLLFFSTISSASSLGIEMTGSGSVMNNQSFTLGWGFDVTTSVAITDLGFWDEGGDGLAGNHAVGLWDSSGTLLASTIITNASAAEASSSGFGNWMFNSIATLIIGPGTYQVGAVVDGTDAYRTIVSSVALNPLLTNFQSNLWVSGSTLQFMTLQEDSWAHNGLFGANLKVTAVPIPGAVWLFGSSLLGLVGLSRRKKDMVAA